jgi:hypothetical protein
MRLKRDETSQNGSWWSKTVRNRLKWSIKGQDGLKGPETVWSNLIPPIWPEMVLNVLQLLETTPNIPKWPKRSKAARNDLRRPQVVRYSPKWPRQFEKLKMAKNNLNWSEMAQSCRKWPKTVSNRPTGSEKTYNSLRQPFMTWNSQNSQK